MLICGTDKLPTSQPKQPSQKIRKINGRRLKSREGEFDLKADGFNLGEKLICGGFIVNLHHYVKRNPEKWLQKSGVSPQDVDELSGVSVYRDGLRILPYGEKGEIG